MIGSNSPFLALLRGVNVGGRNIIAKGDLQICFQDMGFCDVCTYLQSGNVLFRSQERRIGKLTQTIEIGLSDHFFYKARAVVISRKMFRSAIHSAPRDWGRNDQRQHQALFTLGGANPEQVLLKLVSPKTEIEEVNAGSGAIFWSISKADLKKSTFLRLPASPAYRQLTIRNHNTVFRLMELMEKS